MSHPVSSPEQSVRVMQIIAGALVMGAISFAAVAVFVRLAVQNPDEGWTVSSLGAFGAAMMLSAQLVVPNAISRSIAPKQESVASNSSFCTAYLSGLMVGLALLEGAAFFNLVAYIIEGNWWSLAITGVLVFAMLAKFPTSTRVQHWIETQQLTAH